MVQINRVDEIGESEAVDDFFLAHLGEVGDLSAQWFRYEPGSEVEVHSHHQAQIGFIFEGKVELTVDGEEFTIGAGDAYLLESEESHGGRNPYDETAVGIDVFSPPRDAPNWL